MRLSIGLQTDPGPRKGENQDSVLAVVPQDRPDLGLAIVADGMGGAKGGATASREAITVLRRELLEAEPLTRENAPSRLMAAITHANTSIHVKGLDSADMQGMGCTVVVALVIDHVFWIASVGDSRAYLVRKDVVTQLTEDHTWVRQQVRDGVLTHEQAATHSLRHVLERALGADQTIEVDVWPGHAVEPGDVLVLCSDGLYGVLDEEAICEIASHYPPQEAADRLLDRALRAPARDNVSVVVLRLE